MRKDVPYNQYLGEVEKQLKSQGLFLTSKGGKVNTMVIGWGGIVFIWGKPIFMVPVRKSRYITAYENCELPSGPPIY